MIARLRFTNGRFCFLRGYNEMTRLINELCEMAEEYGIERIDAHIVTDKEYAEVDK